MLRTRWPRSSYARYTTVLVLGDLTHLTALVFFAPFLTVSEAPRLIQHRTAVSAGRFAELTQIRRVPLI